MEVSTQYVTFAELPLDSGASLRDVQVAYEAYGALNRDKSNAILITHAFSGDAHAAGISTETGRPGWWETMIGPGKAFDTNRYFVFCSNILAGCKGTTGPTSLDPATGQPYGMRFPQVTMADIVRLQKMLVDHLGIQRLLCVAGGSMGGMQALQWSVMYPRMCASVLPIASTARHSAQQIAFNEVGRQAIMADPDWNGGDYYGKQPPARGLAVARMVGHITYMSDDSMREKFGRRMREMAQTGQDLLKQYEGDGERVFEVESYLRYRGTQFVDRFDANSYLYITRAMDYFDLAAGHQSLGAALDQATARFLVIAFTSDWLYPAYQSKEIVNALRSRNRDVAYAELTSTYGHDAFLIDNPEQTDIVAGFLRSTALRYAEVA